jgi:hypothetical protein
MEPGLFESKIYSINRKLLAELSIGSEDIFITVYSAS